MVTKTSKFDRQIRKIFPSISRLTYNPLFKATVNSLEAFPRIFYPELRNIPPNHMRIRVGVSNRLFSNATHYNSAAVNFWLYCMSEGIVKRDSRIVDIGVGCGRYAHVLRDLKFLNKSYSGKYLGIDIDQELLEWCKENFDKERFEFHHSSHSSKSYVNQNSTESSYVTIPCEDNSVDFVFSTSLYTHLLERELSNYNAEAFRVLKPGGIMMMSVFCLDYPPPTYGTRHTFSHKMGHARVESLRQPEAAVAYTEQYLFEAARKIGFSKTEIQSAPNIWQPRYICVK